MGDIYWIIEGTCATSDLQAHLKTRTSGLSDCLAGHKAGRCPGAAQQLPNRSLACLCSRHCCSPLPTAGRSRRSSSFGGAPEAAHHRQIAGNGGGLRSVGHCCRPDSSRGCRGLLASCCRRQADPVGNAALPRLPAPLATGDALLSGDFPSDS